MQRIGFPTPPPGRPRPRKGALIAVLLGAAVVGGFLFFVAPAQRPQSPDPEPPDTARQETTAIQTVERMVDAIDTGNAAAVGDALAAEWAGIQLPGITRDFLVPSDTPKHIDGAIEFTGAVVDLALGDCVAELGTDPIDYLVRCPVEVTGALPVALGQPLDMEIRAGTAAGEVVSLFHDGETPYVSDYCVWASGEYPELAETAFGATCQPVAQPAQAPAHNVMATGYVAAGVPEPSPDTRDSVTIARVLSGFERLHGEEAIDAPSEASALFANNGPIVRFPGLLPLLFEARDPFPSIPEFLDWSGRVYDVDLGICTISQRYEFGRIRVACPEAVWDGPLVTGLGLAPVPQPIEFIIQAGRITQTLGETNARLAEAADRFCRTAQKELPQFAAQAFRSDCTPNYTAAAADALMTLLEEYGRLLPA